MNITTMSTSFLDTLLGYEDIGNGIGDTTREAKEALVLMAVCMKREMEDASFVPSDERCNG